MLSTNIFIIFFLNYVMLMSQHSKEIVSILKINSCPMYLFFVNRERDINQTKSNYIILGHTLLNMSVNKNKVILEWCKPKDIFMLSYHKINILVGFTVNVSKRNIPIEEASLYISKDVYSVSNLKLSLKSFV